MAEEKTISAALRPEIREALSSAWLNKLRAWRQKRRDRNELKSLSNADLRDLAIDRSEINSIVFSGARDRRRNHNA